MVRGRLLLALLLSLFHGVQSSFAEEPYPVEWYTWFGTSSEDYGSSVAIDAVGDVHLAGRTEGDFYKTNAGS